MQNLWPPLLSLFPIPGTAGTARPSMSIGMVTVIQRKQDLHEIAPDGVFRNGSAGALGLFDDGGEVAAAAVFHDDVEDAGIAVDVAVVIAYNVFVVEVFEDVSGEVLAYKEKRRAVKWNTNTSATICLRSLSDMRSKLSSFLANTWVGWE